jgi:pyrroloquinoline quinone biosynthesis protein B
MLKVLILGSAAGGGSPQWNCNSSVSRAVREGKSGTSPRTQSSIAVTSNDEEWILFNASPDLGSQILKNQQMHPKKDLRHSPISGVVLTNGDVDHVAGLLTLRERQNLSVYAHNRVHSVLKDNSIFNVLNPDYVDRRELRMNEKFELKDKEGKGLGLEIVMDKKPGAAGLTCFKHCYEAGVNFKATGDCLIIAPMFICEKKHIDEIIEKLRTGITNYAKSKKN